MASDGQVRVGNLQHGIDMALMTIRRDWVPWVKRNRLYQLLEHGRRLLDKSYRARNRKAVEDFERFISRRGGRSYSVGLRPPSERLKTALVIRNVSLPYVTIEGFVMKALQMAGFETVVVGRRQYDFLRYDWFIGNETGYMLEDFRTLGDDAWVKQNAERAQSLNDWLSLEYRGVHVGRFVVSSALRNFKRGQLDFGDAAVRRYLTYRLDASVRNVQAATQLFDTATPELVLFLDRGYVGQGEINDLALSRGIDTLAWSPGYKSNRLVFKRYTLANEREHPLAPSADTWARLLAMDWSPEKGELVRRELFDCYKSQDWFSVVGTQFAKEIVSKNDTRRQLALSDEDKVAVVFPHILWDGSFFFGKDLFSDYTEWLVETVREAIANTNVKWIIKLHPAHIIKAAVENDKKRPRELDVLEDAFGQLPEHLRFVHPDTNLSTFSLFEIADYVVTVRGTVGIEAAVFGIQVVTAGTGRYDRRGFTLDSTSQAEYRSKLRNLHDYGRLSADQIELAERYAYGLLFCRPLKLSSISLEYEQDGNATPKVSVACQSREDWLAAPDMRQIVDWVRDGKREDMFLDG